MKPTKAFVTIDKGFKFGASWDWIVGLNRTFVFLIHIGPVVISFAWRTKDKKSHYSPIFKKRLDLI